jgi:hypothetical protein
MHRATTFEAGNDKSIARQEFGTMAKAVDECITKVSGIALRQVRRFEEAITAHTQAAQIYQETGDRHSEGTALTAVREAQIAMRELP